MDKELLNKDLLEIIDQALDKQGISARRASILATGTPELIRNMRRGRVPSVERFRALCDVLNLEFYVGPTRIKGSTATNQIGKKESIYSMFNEIISRLPSKSTTIKMAEPTGLYEDSKEDDVRRIPMLETDLSSNKNLLDKGEQRTSYVAFHLSWFDKHDINLEDCVIVEVRDDFMEPTIPKQSTVLIDRSRCRRHIKHIYAIRLNDDLLIRRLDKNGDEWQFVGDNPKSKTIAMPPDAEIIGEVKWMAKTF